MNHIFVRILANPVTSTMLLICTLGTGFMLSFLAALVIEKARGHKARSPVNDISQPVARSRTLVPLGAIRLNLGAIMRRRTSPEER